MSGLFDIEEVGNVIRGEGHLGLRGGRRRRPRVYFATVLPQLSTTAAAQIAWQRPMLIAIGTSIVLTIIGSILTGIGTGISAEIRERGSAGDIGRKDERDVDIHRRGELAGYYVSSVGVVGVLVLTMLEYPTTSGSPTRCTWRSWWRRSSLRR